LESVKIRTVILDDDAVRRFGRDNSPYDRASRSSADRDYRSNGSTAVARPAAALAEKRPGEPLARD